LPGARVSNLRLDRRDRTPNLGQRCRMSNSSSLLAKLAADDRCRGRAPTQDIKGDIFVLVQVRRPILAGCCFERIVEYDDVGGRQVRMPQSSRDAVCLPADGEASRSSIHRSPWRTREWSRASDRKSDGPDGSRTDVKGPIPDSRPRRLANSSSSIVWRGPPRISVRDPPGSVLDSGRGPLSASAKGLRFSPKGSVWNTGRLISKRRPRTSGSLQDRNPGIFVPARS
jgi:hypothetical protein